MSLRLKKIRIAVFVRANNRCECGCGKAITFESGHLDHFWGRSKAAESVETTWALSFKCHMELKSLNRPSAVYWLRLFREHCRLHRYKEGFDRAQSRIAWLKAAGLAA